MRNLTNSKYEKYIEDLVSKINSPNYLNIEENDTYKYLLDAYSKDKNTYFNFPFELLNDNSFLNDLSIEKKKELLKMYQIYKNKLKDNDDDLELESVL